ncbi:MAG: hypothetical protein KDK62_02130 [Chlamydiia bacterium]|nr:hypothetical protein [Chlamydiia bacterium]
MRNLLLALVAWVNFVSAGSMTLKEMGVTFPIRLAPSDSTLFIPLKDLAGATPSAATLNFQGVESPFQLQIFVGKQSVFSGEIQGNEHVKFPIPATGNEVSSLRMEFKSQDAEQIIAWIDPRSEMEFSPQKSLPIQQFSDLTLFLEKPTLENQEALLNAASELGALYFPWRLKPKWVQESLSSGIMIGEFEKELDFNGSLLKVDSKAVGKLYSFLSGETPLTYDEFAFSQTDDSSSPWSIILPHTFSSASKYSGRLRWHLKVSNSTDTEQELTFSVGSEPSKIVIIPPKTENRVEVFEIETFKLPNRAYFTLASSKGVKIESGSHFTSIPYDGRSIITFQDAARAMLGKGEVILSEKTPEHLLAAFEVVSFLARNQGRPQELVLREMTNRIDKREGDWSVGVLSALDLSVFRPRVDVSWPFVTKSGFINGILFPKGKYISHSFMQIFDLENPMIALTDLSGDYTSWTDSEIWQRVFQFGAPFAQKEEKDWVAIDYNIRFPPIYLDHFRLDLWWADHKGWIVLLWALATAFFLRFVWNKLTFKRDV